jgi:hypothetical protein
MATSDLACIGEEKLNGLGDIATSDLACIGDRPNPVNPLRVSQLTERSTKLTHHLASLSLL